MTTTSPSMRITRSRLRWGGTTRRSRSLKITAPTRSFTASTRQAAAAAGVGRIIYLGGLARDTEDLSPHLRSRHEVGRILRESGVPTLELRAAIIIGSGSLSFEMVRALVQKLPVMITPRWVSQPTQPLAVEDLIAYLKVMDSQSDPAITSDTVHVGTDIADQHGHDAAGSPVDEHGNEIDGRR